VAGEIWSKLEAVSGCGLAASWIWTETWLRHYGEDIPHRFAIVRDGDEPCAAALVTRSSYRKPGIPPVRVLHLGTAGEGNGGVFVEWNRILAGREVRAAAGLSLRRRLEQERDWDELRLNGFDPEHGEALLFDARRVEREVRRAPFTDLHAVRTSGQDVLSALRPGVRRRLRASLRRAGQLQCDWIAEAEEGVRALDQLAKLHGSRWRKQGEAGAFADPRFLAFHSELVRRLLPLGQAFLFRLSGDGQTLGYLYCLIDGDRVLFYQGGFVPSTDNTLRPGLVTHLACMEACLARGYAEYDFLVGDARYKEELSTGARPLLWARVRRPRVRLMIARGRDRLGRVNRGRRPGGLG
jgi:Acetyltransferase (GNAT) domain